MIRRIFPTVLAIVTLVSPVAVAATVGSSVSPLAAHGGTTHATGQLAAGGQPTGNKVGGV